VHELRAVAVDREGNSAEARLGVTFPAPAPAADDPRPPSPPEASADGGEVLVTGGCASVPVDRPTATGLLALVALVRRRR
jgi:MYXO-CTERM domain-containing protein